MSFFKGFKDDMSQAVNELMPDSNEMFDDEDAMAELLESKSEKKAREKKKREEAKKEKRGRRGKRGVKGAQEDDLDIAPEDRLDQIDDLLENELYSSTTEDAQMLLDDDMEVNTMDMSVGDLLSQLSGQREVDQITEEDDHKEQESSEESPSETETEETASGENTEMEDSLKEGSDTGNMEDPEETVMEEEKDMMATDSEEDVAVSEESAPAQEIDRNITHITKETCIKGDIETEDSMEIMGSIEGNVTSKGKVMVGGSVTGNIEAGELYANNARIQGDILSNGSVKIGVGSMIIGGIVGDSAVIAGAVNGDIDVQGPVIVDSTAVIMGNIKSRSVQINNGAVIEGFCSQSYSDIDVKNFFS